jgi:hypothetical protein
MALSANIPLSGQGHQIANRQDALSTEYQQFQESSATARHRFLLLILPVRTHRYVVRSLNEVSPVKAAPHPIG